MPLSPRHKQQRGKNLLVLAILAVVIIGLYQLSMTKVGGAG
jgi:hypothetical protein